MAKHKKVKIRNPVVFDTITQTNNAGPHQNDVYDEAKGRKRKPKHPKRDYGI